LSGLSSAAPQACGMTRPGRMGHQALLEPADHMITLAPMLKPSYFAQKIGIIRSA
jgi:hypothetical protein